MLFIQVVILAARILLIALYFYGDLAKDVYFDAIRKNNYSIFCANRRNRQDG